MTEADRAWLNHMVNTQCQIIYTRDLWSSEDIARQVVEMRKYIEKYLKEREARND